MPSPRTALQRVGEQGLVMVSTRSTEHRSPRLTVQIEDIRLTRSALTVAVVATGEVDTGTASHLERQLTAACGRTVPDRPTRVTVDLEQVTYMNSSGLVALVDGQANADEFRLVAPSRAVLRIIRLAAIDHEFVIVDRCDMC